MRSWKNYNAACYLISAASLVAGFLTGTFLFYGSALALLTARQCMGEPDKRLNFPLIILALTGLMLPVDLSDDVYRYLWEGYVQTEGFSPYSNSPESLFERLDHPHEDRVNHPHLTAIYPPMTQYLFALAAFLSKHLLAWKLLLGATLLGFALHPAGRPVVPWLASPLLLFEGFWNAHLDILGLVPAFLLVRALKNDRPLEAGFHLGLMTALKILPGLLLPACLLHFPMRQWPRLLASSGLVVLLAWLPYLHEGENLFASFITFSRTWHFNNPLFPLLQEFLHHDRTRPVMAICLLLAAAAATLARTSTTQRIAGVWMSLYIFSPTLYPWYLMWLIPFVHPERRAHLNLAYAGAALSYLILIPYRATGVWQESLWWLIPEWLILLWCFQAIWRAPKNVVT
ncbi:MAG: glycosyltransferase family 87 protein [Acidobacteriota bacterium]|nr:glycosyltransferase family 87 protein [Acidobacteriota bacterium]